MKLATITWVVLPFPLDREQFASMNPRQRPNNRCQIIAKKSPTIIETKACNGVVVIFIAKDNAFNRTFELWHINLFHKNTPKKEKYHALILAQAVQTTKKRLGRGARGKFCRALADFVNSVVLLRYI